MSTYLRTDITATATTLGGQPVNVFRTWYSVAWHCTGCGAAGGHHPKDERPAVVTAAQAHADRCRIQPAR